MKCMAREVMFQQKSRMLGDKWGKELLEFLEASCGAIFRKKDKWGKIRLQRMYNNTNSIMTGAFVKYLAADTTTEVDREKALAEETIIDSAETAIYAMTRDLRYCGFDYFAERDKLRYHHKFYDKWHPQNERDMYALKAAWLDRSQNVVDVYMLTALIYARTECGYGEQRLRERHELFVKDFHSWLDFFLDPTHNSVAVASRMTDERFAIVEDAGIQTEDLNLMNTTGKEIG